MKQLKLTFLLTVLMSMMWTRALAYDACIDGIYYTFFGKDAFVTYMDFRSTSNKSAYTGSVVIPSAISYNGFTFSVTGINDYAFYNCSDLTNVTIPNSVTTISIGAFEGCSGLTSIIIPTSVTSIGASAFEGTTWYANQPDGLVYAGKVAYKYKGSMPYGTNMSINEGTLGIAGNAFWGCSGLSSVTIPEGVVIIGNGAFARCNLTSVTIPSSVTIIDNGAFMNCNSLSSITIPSSVTTIGLSAFEGTAWYEKQPNGLVYAGNVAYKFKGTMPDDTNLEIKEGTVGIAGDAFYNCSGLVSIKIPLGVVRIGDWAFQKCSRLTTVNIPESVNSIGFLAFENCYPLTSVTIPESVTKILYGTFKNCRRLTNLSIPNSVTGIANEAFSGCSELASINLGKSVMTIGENAFYDNNLKSITANMKTPAITVYKSFSSHSATLNVPKGCKATYQAADYWKEFKEIVEMEAPSPNIEFADANVKALCVAKWDTNGDGELSEAEAATVTDLERVFCYNTSIKNFGELRYFTGLTNIGYSAFSNCSNLISIIIPNNVTLIDELAFYNCKELVTVNLPDGIKGVGRSAFQNCSNISQIDLVHIGYIGNEAFSGCSKLKNISFSENITNIGAYAFHGTQWYDNQPDGPLYIGKCLYKYKGQIPLNLTIVIDEGTATIVGRAFENQGSLTSVVIPQSVKSIGNYAFTGCFCDVTVMNSVPIRIENTTFPNSINQTLYVPYGSASAYRENKDWNYWRYFMKIVEMDDPNQQPALSDNDKIVVAEATVIKGQQSTIGIGLENETTDLTAYQFDLTLPDGISLSQNDKGKYIVTKTERYEDDSQTLNISKQEGNTYRFVCFSMSNEIITGTSGAILNASLTIGANINTGSYEATITNIVVTKKDGTQLKLKDSKFNIVVTDIIKGDANGDREVNVSDIVEIVNYIMGKPSANFVLAAADLNGDGEVNVTDIVKVVSIIMDSNSSSAPLHRSAINGNLTLSREGLIRTAMLQHAEQFTAAQYDIILGDGQEIDDISLNSNSDHCLSWKMTEEGTCRVVVYSLTNSAFAVNGNELMNIRLKGKNGKVAVGNVILVATDSNATGISKVTTDQSAGNWYTLDGRQLGSQPAKKGIYIKNGKKFVVK